MTRCLILMGSVQVEFNFGIVDISSGMKRVENSKEAFRNLVLIADDGSSEYSGVNLTPSDWFVSHSP